MDMQEAYAKADFERLRREIAQLKLENQRLKDEIAELQAALRNRAG